MTDDIQTAELAVEHTTESEAGQGYTLPGRMDTDHAAPLQDHLQSMRGAPAQLDGQDVVQIGASCLAVLIAAARSWAADGHRLTLITPSDAMIRDMHRMGLSVDDLNQMELAA